MSKTHNEMNAWLLDRCVAYAKAYPHPEFPRRGRRTVDIDAGRLDLTGVDFASLQKVTVAIAIAR